MKERTILLWPDSHIPYHDKRAVRLLIGVVADLQPDELCLLGDWLDCKAPARWSKAAAEEFAAGLDYEAETARHIQADIRDVYDGRITWIEGNHELRVRTYLHKYAPALRGIVPSVPELLEFDIWDIEEMPQPYKIAPGTLAIHGYRMSSTQQAAGQSAYKERMRFGMSVVQGHTHRAGLGFDTQERTRFWMETGHLLDLSQADYLEFPKTANWQQGFGLLHVSGNRVHPELFYIQAGKTYVSGKAYAA